MAAFRRPQGPQPNLHNRDVFHCEVCQISMDLNCKASHLSGQKHLIQMVKANLADVPEDRHYCEMCGTLKVETEEKHVASRAHQKRIEAQKKWEARQRRNAIAHQKVVARRVIPIEATGVSRECFRLIGNDTDYCAPEEVERAEGCQRVKDTGIKWQAFIEAGVDIKTENDLVTPEDIQKARKCWNARRLAYQIDTQWGAIPGGGAFKHSNHYYAADEYALL